MIYGLLALLVVLVDQATKYFVVQHFAVGESVPVLENIFHWTFILNRGAAFGMLEGSRWLFVVIALAVIGGVLYLRKEIEQSGVLACMGAALFTGGAVGNLIDRTLHGVVKMRPANAPMLVWQRCWSLRARICRSCWTRDVLCVAQRFSSRITS